MDYHYSMIPMQLADADKTESWYGVRDSVQRRRIQNRLAQRTRRKRLAGRDDRGKQTTSCPDEHKALDISSTLHSSSSSASSTTVPESEPPLPLRQDEPDEAAAINHAPIPTIERSSLTGLQYAAFSLPSTPQVSLVTSVPVTVYTALFQNGEMMGLKCGFIVPHKSSRQGPHIPASLQPTALQLTTFHVPWIDRFPFPKMRDNFIGLTGIIDEEEFLRDLFTMDGLSLKPNGLGSDPASWIMGRDFGKKWGYLWY